jgi:hypothetical protein
MAAEVTGRVESDRVERERERESNRDLESFRMKSKTTRAG